MKRLAVTLLSVAALMGMKFYNKGQASEKVKQRLVVLCEGDAGCIQSVNTHFESCFEQAYKLGGRYQSSRLEGGELVSCLNSRAGREYFTFKSQ